LRPHRGVESYNDSSKHPDFNAKLYGFKKKKLGEGEFRYIDDPAVFDIV